MQSSASHPQVMRILAEEAVEELTGRFHCLGIPLKDSDSQPPFYWRSYMQAVKSGELLDTDYRRFQKALVLAGAFLDDSYIDDEDSLRGDYKTMRYAYALSSNPLPPWFSPDGVMERLEELVTACGFLWFAIVDYAEEQYTAKGA